jgi:hypothetical protein
MTQLSLFDLVTGWDALYTAHGFVSNGTVAVPVSRYHIDHPGLAGFVERYSSPANHRLAYVVAELPPLPELDLPRMLAFAPAGLEPPYDDPDQLYLVNADLVHLVTGELIEDAEEYVSYRCDRYQVDNHVMLAVAVYDAEMGTLLGFCGAIRVGDDKRAAIRVALVAALGEVTNG